MRILGRKRKSKCVYLSSLGPRCVECEIKQSDCFAQEYAPPPEESTARWNLKKRVARLENAVLMIQNAMSQTPAVMKSQKLLPESESPSNDDEVTSPLSDEPSPSDDVATDVEAPPSVALVGELESAM